MQSKCSLRICRQKLSIVVIWANCTVTACCCRCSFPGSSSSFFSIAAWIRSRISAAAAFVKVMTRSRSISIGLSPVIILMIRSTRTAVLPLPAAAETSRFRFLLSITAFCSFVQFTVIFRLPPFSASAISVCPAVFWCVFVNLLPDIFRVQLIKPPVSVPICF